MLGCSRRWGFSQVLVEFAFWRDNVYLSFCCTGIKKAACLVASIGEFEEWTWKKGRGLVYFTARNIYWTSIIFQPFWQVLENQGLKNSLSSKSACIFLGRTETLADLVTSMWSALWWPWEQCVQGPRSLSQSGKGLGRSVRGWKLGKRMLEPSLQTAWQGSKT